MLNIDIFSLIEPKKNLAITDNALFVGGAQVRRNSSMSIFNSIILDYPNGLFIDATKGIPIGNNIHSALLVQNTIIASSPYPVLYSYTGNVVTPSTTATFQHVLILLLMLTVLLQQMLKLV